MRLSATVRNVLQLSSRMWCVSVCVCVCWALYTQGRGGSHFKVWLNLCTLLHCLGWLTYVCECEYVEWHK